MKHESMQKSNVTRWRVLCQCTLLLLLIAVLASGCTLIRYRDHNDPDGGTVIVEPKVVDMLVLVDLERSAANLGSYYEGFLFQLIAALAVEKVTVRDIGLAPLYQRAGEVVPLIYGSSSELEDAFGAPQHAIFFYTYDDGALYLQENAESEGENLAQLGMELDQLTLYHPSLAMPQARAYFSEPEDGLIVVYFSANARRCGFDEENCQLDGKNAAEFFADTNAHGQANWLTLPGQTGLSPRKIFHLPVVTAEGVDFSGLERQCSSQPHFPASLMDFIAPSSKKYYEPFIRELRRSGGQGSFVDFCQAMSSRSITLSVSLAKQIAGTL